MDGVRLADNGAEKSSQGDDSGGESDLHDDNLAEDAKSSRVRKSKRGMSSRVDVLLSRLVPSI